MTHITADRVYELSITVGTGNMALSGAVSGYYTFASAMTNGDTCYYVIFDSVNGDNEEGVGTYVSSGNSLVRTTVLHSSNSGSLVNFLNHTKDVFLTAPAAKMLQINPSGSLITGPIGTVNGGTGLTALGSGIQSALAASPTGTGSFVLNTSPALTTPDIGVATGYSLTLAHTVRVETANTDAPSIVFGGNTSPGVYPTPNFGGAISVNATLGQGEVDYWNTYLSANVSHRWYQQTGTTSANVLMSVSSAGVLNVSSIAVTGDILAANISATGLVLSGTLNVTGTVLAGTVLSTGSVLASDLISTHNVLTTNVTATGSILAASVNSTGSILGASLGITGNTSLSITYIHGVDNTDSLRVFNTGLIKFVTIKPETSTDTAQIGYWTGSNFATLSVPGTLATTTINNSATITSGAVNVTGALTAGTLNVTGTIAAGAVLSVGSVLASSLISTSNVLTATVNATGSILAASLAATGNIIGANLGVTGSITATNMVITGNTSYGHVYPAQSGQTIYSSGIITTTTTLGASSNISPTNAEFGFGLDFVSNTGKASGGNPASNKVGLYIGVTANPNSGNVWTINPLLNLTSGSVTAGSAQIGEFDLAQNTGVDFGDGFGFGGVVQPAVFGAQWTGAGTNRATAVHAIFGTIAYGPFTTSIMSGTGSVAVMTYIGTTVIPVGSYITVIGVVPSGYNTSAANVLESGVVDGSHCFVKYSNTTTGSQSVAGTLNVPYAPLWNRGIVAGPYTIRQSMIEDYSNSNQTMYISGSHVYGILFDQFTGFSGSAIRFGAQQKISWRDQANSSDLNMIQTDSSNNLLLNTGGGDTYINNNNSFYTHDLHVATNAYAQKLDLTNGLYVYKTTTAMFDGPVVELWNPTSTLGNQGGVTIQHGLYSTSTGYFAISQLNYAGSYFQPLMIYDMNANTWDFYSAGGGTVRIDSSGNVGIGTLSPGARIHAVLGSDNVNIGIIQGSSYAIRMGTKAGVGATIQAVDPAQTVYEPLYVSGSEILLGISGGTGGLKVTTNGNVFNSTGSSAGMTDGFFYIPAAGGAPSATPTVIAGSVPMYYDATNNQFYVYNGAWKKVTLT